MSEMLVSVLSFWGAGLANASLAALLIVPAAWAIETFWKSMPSSWRSWMWRLVFVKVLGVAVFPYAIELPVLPATEEVASRNAAASIESVTDANGVLAGTQSVASPSEGRPTRSWRWSQVLPVLFALWGLGVAANAVVALLGRNRVEQSRRLTTYMADGPAISALEALYHRFGLRKRPDLIATCHEGSPFVADWVRPAIYCPSAWLSSCNANEMRLAFAHELAHLARRDLAWNRFVAICQAILFFHPLMWLAAWRYRTAQEIACDEMALARTGGSPCDLARLLVGFVEQDSARFYGVAAMTGASVTIRERVLAMQRTMGSKSPGMWTTALAVIVALLVLTPWTLAKDQEKVKRKKRKQSVEQKEEKTESNGASASGSATGSISGGGSGSITVTAPGTANTQQSGGQQSASNSRKVDVSESSTTTKDGQTVTTNKRTVTVVDDDHEVQISETDDEVRISIIDRKSGEEKTYVAKNANDLKEKYTEAFSAYQKYMPRKTSVKTAASTIRNKREWRLDKRFEEKDQKLDKDPKPSAANKLKKRSIEAQMLLEIPEVKGTPMEQMIRNMLKRAAKKDAAEEADADEEDGDDDEEEGDEDEEAESEEEEVEEPLSVGIAEEVEVAIP